MQSNTLSMEQIQVVKILEGHNKFNHPLYTHLATTRIG